MTQFQVIDVAKSLRSSTMSDDVLARMLSELEGRIEIELHGKTDWKDKGTLSVPNPYDRVYWTYLVAMLDLYDNHFDSYPKTYEEFCRAYESYANHCLQKGG